MSGVVGEGEGMTCVDVDIDGDEFSALGDEYWSCGSESESESDSDEEEGYTSLDEVIDFSNDRTWGNGQGVLMVTSEDTRSELAMNADTKSADFFGTSTALSLGAGVVSRRRRRRGSREGEQ